MGAGNKVSVFNRKARSPYSEYAEIFRREIKKQKDQDPRLTFRELSDAEKKALKRQVKEIQKARAKRIWISTLMSILFSLVLLYLLALALRYVFF